MVRMSFMALILGGLLLIVVLYFAIKPFIGNKDESIVLSLRFHDKKVKSQNVFNRYQVFINPPCDTARWVGCYLFRGKNGNIGLPR